MKPSEFLIAEAIPEDAQTAYSEAVNEEQDTLENPFKIIIEAYINKADAYVQGYKKGYTDCFKCATEKL